MMPMKKRLFIILFVLSLIHSTLGCGDDQAPVFEQKTPEVEGIIAAVGDSLTEGLGVAEEFAYPALLGKKLQENGYPYQVVNAGISGETSSATLARIEWVLTTLKPDIVILVIGANDGFRGIAPDLIKTNILAIIKILKENNVTVLIGGMQIGQNLGKEYVDAFENIYSQAAREEKVGLIPFFLSGVAANPQLNQPDGIHPTAEGYRAVVDHIFPHVIEAIKAHKENR
jgi:acyl-CoA thioesterase-1